MSVLSRVTLPTLASLGLLLCGAPSRAQDLPFAGAPVEVRALGSTRYRELHTDSEPVSVLTLAWRGLSERPLAVSRDGSALKEAEFTVDRVNGAVRLLKPAQPGQVILVAYEVDPKKAQTNPVFPSSTFPRRGEVELEALRTVQRQTLRNRLASKTGIQPPVDPKTGARTNPEAFQDEFLSGLRQTALLEQVSDPNGGTARTIYFRNDALDPRSAGDSREELDSKVNLPAGAGGKLAIENYLSRESLFTEDYQEYERRKIAFEQTWGKSTTALMWERRRSDGYRVGDSLDALSLAVTHPFNANTQGEAYLSQEESLFRGRETQSFFTLRRQLGSRLEAQFGGGYRLSQFAGNTLETGGVLTARPSDKSEATLSFREANSELYGKQQRFSLEGGATLSRQVQLSVEASRRTSQALGAIDNYGMGLALRPNARTMLEAAFSESTGAAIGREQARSLRLTADPASSVKIQLGYDLLRSHGNGTSSDTNNALWLVTLGGKRYVKLEGYAADRLVDADRFRDALYRVEVRPFLPIALSGSFREVRSGDENSALAGVGAKVQVLRVLDVSGAYRRPPVTGALPSDQTGRDVRVGLMPVEGFRLFGGYTDNPENDRGQLLLQKERTVGVETRLGSFGLQGSLSRMEGQFLPDSGRRLDLLASLTMGGTRLYGGYRTEDALLLDAMRAATYRLGISQTVGPTFFLTLEGQIGYLEDGAGSRIFNTEDARAQARIGLRF